MYLGWERERERERDASGGDQVVWLWVLLNFPLLHHQWQIIESFKVQISQWSCEQLLERFLRKLLVLSPQNLFVSTENNSIESIWFSKNVSLLNQARHFYFYFYFSSVQIWEKRFFVKPWLWLVAILCTSLVINFFFSIFLCGKDVFGFPENCLVKEKFCFWIWKWKPSWNTEMFEG